MLTRAGWPSHGSRISASHPCHDFPQFCAHLHFSERQPHTLSMTELLATYRHDLTFSCLGCTICFCPAYMQFGSLGIIFIQIILPSSFLTSPTVFVSHGNIISNHLISSRPVTKMSQRTGQVEDLCKTSLRKHPFNNESLFVLNYILRCNTALFFILLMCILRVFYHCSFFVRKHMVNQIFYGIGSIYYI